MSRKRERETPPPRTVLAAAMPMNGPEARRVAGARASANTDQWQSEAWYYYDAVGELRSALTWIANAVSKADLHAAELDPETGVVGDATDDERVRRVAAMALGGPSTRPHLQRTLALCWQVAGEAWVVVRPRPARNGVPQPDEWLVLSNSRVTAKGKGWTYTDPATAMTVTLKDSDLLLRVWSPHPNDQSKADSGVRPALPTLREVEKSSQNIAARLDSRIGVNGLAAVAEELDFPQGDHDTKGDAFMAWFLAGQEAGLRNPGQPAAQVPLTFTAPAELIGNDSVYRHFDISTQFDASVIELRQDALSRLASSLDMPKETAEGSMGEANHWSAWQVEESTYKIFIEPLLDRISEAITQYWFHPALTAMGVSNPERYVLTWDTTSIVARPDATEDQKWAFEQLLISEEAMANELGIAEDQMPNDEERRRRFLERLVTISPAILSEAGGGVADELGLDTVANAARAAEEETRQAAEQRTEAQEQRALPSGQGERPEPAAVPEGLVAAAELIVFDALSRAGGRLLTRSNRAAFASVPKYELHTVIGDGPDDKDLLEGSFLFTDTVADAFGLDRFEFKDSLERYVVGLFDSCAAHNRRWLVRDLTPVWRGR
jgi:hypothetical protein